MANNNFLVQNGLTAGPTTIFAANGDIISGGNITTVGQTTFSNTVNINANLFVTNSAVLNSTLTVNGATTINSTLIANSGVNSQSTTSGAFQVVGGVGVTQDITIGGNIIQPGTGFNLLPVGNIAQRPQNPTVGMIRYNSDINGYEGYSSSQIWTGLGGVRSVDGKAYVISELYAGAGDDVIRVYSGDSGTSTQVMWASSSNVSILPTTDATSATTGALQVAGGAGIGGDVFLGRNLTIAGTAYAPTNPNPFVVDNSLITTQFLATSMGWSMATVPLSNIYGGTYSFASLGFGLQITYTANKSGAIISVISVDNYGQGYYNGDIFSIPAGNQDAILRVTSEVASGATSAEILYGGTGYPEYSAQSNTFIPGMPASTYIFNGVLTDNATVIVPNGTYTTGSNQWYISNNTTNDNDNDNFDVLFKLTNGTGGTIGTGVTAIRGSNNSRITVIQTDGVNDIYSVTGQTYIAYIDAGGTSDVLTANYDPPFTQLTDGLTIGCGAQVINLTSTPTLNVNGLGAYTITKGTNVPLLVGDIGGNNHEMLLTFNMGTQNWVLQNPIYGVATTGIQYHDANDYQYFTFTNLVGKFIDSSSGNPDYPDGEPIFQGASLTSGSANGFINTFTPSHSSMIIEGSTFTGNGATNSLSIWELGQIVYGQVSGARAVLSTANTFMSTDRLEINFETPYQQLLDGLTVGGGAQYVNTTTAPLLNVDNHGFIPVTKGTDVALLPGDIGGNNHEMLLTYNLGINSWVLQNPIYGITSTGVQYIDAAGTSDELTMNFAVPYQALLDGLTVGGGAQYVNTTTTPTLNVDGLGAFVITKGTNSPLLIGDIGGNNHEMLLTFNLGTQNWVLQNPIFGISTTGIQYADSDDLQYFYANIISGQFITETDNNSAYPDGEIVYQGPNLAYATATGTVNSVMSELGANTIVIENSVFTANGGSGFFGIWNIGQHIRGANSGATANVYSFQSLPTTDTLNIEFAIPYQALIDGLTVGGGSVYPNQTPTPTLNVDGLGAYPVVKGTNRQLLPGDIGGANHEMLLTFNLGTTTWVLQNPMYGVGGVGTMFSADSGSINAMVAHFSPPFTNPINGSLINVEPAYTNTGSSVTLQVDQLGVLPVVREGGFPLLPGDIIGNGNYYALLTYNNGAWVLINPQNTLSPNVVINSGFDSTTTTSGALQITGGAGITGNVTAKAIYGNVYDTGNRVISSLSSSGVGNLSIAGTAPALTIALPATGSGAVSAGSSTTIPVLSTDAYGRVVSLSSTPMSTTFSQLATTGNTYLNAPVTVTGVATISNTTESTGLGTGALQVAGGAGINKNLYVGESIYVAGNIYAANLVTQTTVTLTATSSLVYAPQAYYYPYNFDIGLYGKIQPTSSATVQYTTLARNHATGYWTFASNVQATPNGTTFGFSESDIVYDPVQAGQLILSNPISATNNTTGGALQVAGDAAIAGNVFAGSVYSNNFTFSNGTPISITTLSSTSQISVSATTGYNVGMTINNSGVLAGTYGSSLVIPTITVGADGRVTSVTTNNINTQLNLTGQVGSGQVPLLSSALNFVGDTHGLTSSVTGQTVTYTLPQNLQTSASPTFANLTISSATSLGSLSVSGSSALLGQTVIANGIRVYSAASSDGTDNYGDIRFNSGNGSMAISAKTGALYLQYDHGTGVVFGNGSGSQVGTVDGSGNANFIGAITQNGSQVLTAANYNSYTPTLTGGGANGTWAINISGAAATTPAGSLTGTALASGVVNSSLTTVGILSGLTVGGTTTHTGLTNAAGGLVASTVSAGTIGNTGAVINGTINTAAQPNITSVGTLTSLTVNGVTSHGGSILPTTSNAYAIGSSTAWFTGIYGTSIHAQYADLAENYQADQAYEAGTVVMFGGEEEVTLADADTTRVAGVVSTNPAYLMNDLLTGATVVAIALQGRVPCQVVGPVRKGDMMVSAGNGYARANNTPNVGQVIGKALENFDGTTGIIEVVVGKG